ncbi:MAG: dTDP-4-dehydrorhamnose 3,5-epimerase [Gammaproteobacteria bacterium]|nr:dTDP-4-dehydrorhamnose 3,5-epimerase [Gammaproteobacteria bacterium]
MKVIQTSLPDLLQLELQVFEDKRGFFLESYHSERYQKIGIREPFLLEGHSYSTQGVLRGLHYQRNHIQAKLIRVVHGEIFDAVVDIRENSPTFGHYYSTLLSRKNAMQLYVPKGFAHGFCVLSRQADVEYKLSDYYHPEEERGIVWSDPDLAIPWPIQNPILSERDAKFDSFRDYLKHK